MFRGRPRLRMIILLLGLAAMFADVLYEGLRSALGPYFASLGAGVVTATLLGVTPEIFVAAGRLASVFLARLVDPLAILAGSYLVTGVAVPAVGLTGTLTVVSALYCAERFARGVRGPVRDTILSIAAGREKTGLAFGVLEVLDQAGAVLGPAYITLVILLTGSIKTSLLLLGAFTVPLTAVTGLLWRKLRGVEATLPRAELRLGRQEILLILLLSLPWLATPHFIAYSDLLTHYLKPELITLSYAVAMAVDAILAIPLGMKTDTRSLLIVPTVSTLLPLIPALHTTQIMKAVLIGTIYGTVTSLQEVTVRTIIALHTTHTKRLTTYATTYIAQTITQLTASILITKLTTTQYTTYTLTILLILLITLTIKTKIKTT